MLRAAAPRVGVTDGQVDAQEDASPRLADHSLGDHQVAPKSRIDPLMIGTSVRLGHGDGAIGREAPTAVRLNGLS